MFPDGHRFAGVVSLGFVMFPGGHRFVGVVSGGFFMFPGGNKKLYITIKQHTYDSDHVMPPATSATIIWINQVKSWLQKTPLAPA